MTLVAQDRGAEDLIAKAHRRFRIDWDESHLLPDIMEFVRSPEFLNRPNVYPRQGTLLKLIFLEIETLTSYDYWVIDGWEKEYIRTEDEKGEGNHGIVPGVLDRVRYNRMCPCGHDRSTHVMGSTSECLWREGGQEATAEGITEHEPCECDRYRGRWWFREVVAVIGRRGSKGHVGALAGAYILWHFIQKKDPQGWYGIDRDKRLTAIVFGGKKEQAKANQWRDLNNIILGAPCFTEYISKPQAERLTVRAPIDFIRKEERSARGVDTDQDLATFEIIPKESTVIAARGPAAFLQYYDEAAHVVKGVANTPAEEVYESATPALDQFGREGFIYLPSSPWQKIGLFYEKYQEAIEFDEETGEAVYPEKLMIQLTSWDIYKDWQNSHLQAVYPKGYHPKGWTSDIYKNGFSHYPTFRGAIQSYDRELRQLERANPETFKVERRGHFAAVMDAYLNPDRIKTIWEPWPEGEKLEMRSKRDDLSINYRAHGDPSKSGAGFGFAIGHVVKPAGSDFPHVVFDLIHAWLPQDYEDHQIDYAEIGSELRGILDNFMPAELTFDQFNSVGTIQMLQKHARRQKYPKKVAVYERPATGPLNWKTWESFKTALGLGLIHAPYFELADLELTFLQDLGGKVDHPTAGPVQSKDVADCMAIVTYELIGDEMMSLIGQELSDFGMSAQAQGGFDPYGRQSEEAHQKLSEFGRGRSNPSRGGYPRR